MKTKKIQEALHQAVMALPVPNVQTLLDAPIVKMTEHDFITAQTDGDPARRRNWVGSLTAIACCCALLITLLGAWFVQYRMVDSIVTLDVNPSIGLILNRRDQVLDVIDINWDAQPLLSGKEYRGQDIPVVIADLMTILVDHQYLNSSHNTILLSVENKKGTRINALEACVSTAIRSALEPQKINPQIIVQAVVPDKSAQDKAQQYHLSPGKLQFITDILEERSDHTLAELATMSMEQLLRLSEGDDFDDDLEDPDEDDDPDDDPDDDRDDDPDEDPDEPDDWEESDEEDAPNAKEEIASNQHPPSGSREESESDADSEDESNEERSCAEEPEPSEDDEDDFDEESS